MVGYKKKNCYRRTRKGKGFTGNSRWNKPKTDVHSTMIQSPSASVTLEDDDMPTRPSASRKVLYERGYSEETDTNNEDSFDSIGRGYRLMDLDSLASTVFDLHQCEKGVYVKQHLEYTPLCMLL